MQPLALAAVLLMALLPGAGRLHQALHSVSGMQAEASAPTALQALCTTQGLGWAHVPSDAYPTPQRGTPARPAHHPGADCDYCTLLGGLALPPTVAVHAERVASRPSVSWRETFAITSPHASLGARGPPGNV